MTIKVAQTPVIIHLTVKDKAGTTVHYEEYEIASDRALPPLPDFGEKWDVVIGADSRPTEVTHKRLTSFWAGDAITTQVHITATAT